MYVDTCVPGAKKLETRKLAVNQLMGFAGGAYALMGSNNKNAPIFVHGGNTYKIKSSYKRLGDNIYFIGRKKIIMANNLEVRMVDGCRINCVFHLAKYDMLLVDNVKLMSLCLSNIEELPSRPLSFENSKYIPCKVGNDICYFATSGMYTIHRNCKFIGWSGEFAVEMHSDGKKTIHVSNTYNTYLNLLKKLPEVLSDKYSHVYSPLINDAPT